MSRIKNITLNKTFANLAKTFATFAVIFLLFALNTQAQVTTKTDTTKIRIGEQIILKYTTDKVQNVQFPKTLQLDSLRRLEVVKSFDIDTVNNQLIKKYAITSFDSGRYALPEQLVMSNGKILKTDRVFIDVSTVAVDTTKQNLFPIKAIQSQEFTLKDYAKNYWLWILFGLFWIGLVWYIFFRKKETDDDKYARLIAKKKPYELAVSQLEDLDKKELWQNNKTKEYYSELTDILRNYIEKELKIPAMESTTSEVVNAIKKFKNINKLDISKKTILKLKDLLKEADLVKFAKSKPLDTEISIHRKDADTILEGLKSDEFDVPEEIVSNEDEAKEIETVQSPTTNDQKPNNE